MNTTPNRRRSPKWIRSDKIGLIGLIVAIVSLIVAIVAITAPIIGHKLREDQKPLVLITSPINGALEPNNAFGASGVAENIPANYDVWLVVQSDAYYPFNKIRVAANGRWNISTQQICTSSGANYIEVYLVPDTTDGPLFTFANDDTKHLVGIESMPPDAILAAFSHINVSNDLKC